MSKELLRVDNLKQHFPIRRGLFQTVVGHVRAVDGVSFQINEGETLGLVGESGCGKTTVGRTLLQLLEPTEGEIFYRGENITGIGGDRLRALRREMQIVFQDPYSSLNPRMTVEGIVEEGLLIHGIGTAEQRAAKVRETLSRVGLDPSYVNRYPHEFSGGQRQRISIARALALGPKFIVLDEPISALDVSIQSQIINLLADLRKEFGLTYLFISHDLLMVEYLSDRVAVMYMGQIVEQAPADELYKNPLQPYTKILLSSTPSMDPEHKRERIVPIGEPPSPSNPPAGCRFHPRCPLAKDICRSEVPPLLDYGAEHWAACHVVQEELKPVKSPAGTTGGNGAPAATAPQTNKQP